MAGRRNRLLAGISASVAVNVDGKGGQFIRVPRPAGASLLVGEIPPPRQACAATRQGAWSSATDCDMSALKEARGGRTAVNAHAPTHTKSVRERRRWVSTALIGPQWLVRPSVGSATSYQGARYRICKDAYGTFSVIDDLISLPAEVRSFAKVGAQDLLPSSSDDDIS
jgi:hypothetical protein